MFEGDAIERALTTLGELLEERGQGFEVVAIGGSALLLLGLSHRPTKDLDVLAIVEKGEYVLADPLPAALVAAARDVGAIFGFGSDWLNPGPTMQVNSGLPAGFKQRVETRTYGSLVLHLPGRFDLICLKLFALVDQWSVWSEHGKHANDLRQLAPTSDELVNAARWVRTQDIGAGFSPTVSEVLKAFGVEDGEAHS